MLHTKAVPKVNGNFLLGNLNQMMTAPCESLINWQQEHGDVLSFRLASREFYLFSHPNLIEQALIKQTDVFEKIFNPNKPSGLELVLGQGLVTSQGNLWKTQRRIMQPVFQKANINSLTAQMINAGNAMLERWRQLGEGAEVNLSSEMMRLTLEVITQTMFSTSVLDKIDQIGPCLDTLINYAGKSILNPLLPPLFIPTRQNRKFKRDLAVLDEIINGIIHQRLNSPTQHNDLLDMLLTARDESTGEGMSDKQLRDEVITIFSAGHETASNLLSWALYLLGRHPKVWSKLREEVDGVLQGKVPSNNDLHQLVYTKAVLNESLRMRPPIAAVVRKVSKDTEIDGYFLKAGRLALFSIYNLHHHTDHWQQPELFNPDRFLSAENRRFAFMPFGTGEHVCIGSHFSMMEGQILLAMIVQHCDLQLLDTEEVKMQMSITLRPKGGVPVRIKWR
jgi:cytochrome P450